MKKEIKESKYQVQWIQKDERGYYTTFVFTQNKEEAEIYAKTATLNGGFKLQIIPIQGKPIFIKENY